MSNGITIKDVKAIRELNIDLPDNDGGVLVLVGGNAQGKTTAIECVQALLSGSGRLDARDHAKRGRVEGFGGSLSVATQTRRSGEIEVDSLHGRFDLGALVDPGLKSAEAADTARIKALLSITGAKADPALFWPLVGGKENFESLVDAKALDTTDLVTLAGAVTRNFHTGARHAESQAEHARTREKASREIAAQVDTTGESDEAILRQNYTAAVRHEEKVKEKRNAYLESKETRETLKQQLEDARKRSRLEAAQDQYAAAEKAAEDQAVVVRQAQERVDELQRQTAEAERELQKAKVERQHLLDLQQEKASALENQQQNAQTIQSLEKSLENLNAMESPPTTADCEDATAAVQEANDALINGARIRDAQAEIEKANKAAEEAAKEEKYAALLRDAAKKVDDILADCLPAGPLRVDGGRLVCDSPRGKGVPFAEESDGYRYSIAVEYGIQLLASMPNRAPLPLSQDAWQHLDYEHRVQLANLCKERKVWLITAEASTRQNDQRDLHVEKFTGA